MEESTRIPAFSRADWFQFGGMYKYIKEMRKRAQKHFSGAEATSLECRM